MTRLVWDAPGQRIFEAGVDRGLLSVDGGAPVPWNGLINVTETPVGGETSQSYIDGYAYDFSVSSTVFSGSIEAFTYPEEFEQCDGTMYYNPSGGSTGFAFGDQPRKPFNLAYRTQIGNAENPDAGYKLHFVYNAYALPSDKAYDTYSDETEPTTFSWSIQTIPITLTGVRPTSHIFVDSTKTDPGIMGLIEAYLYGADGIAPRFPAMGELQNLFTNFSGFDFSNIPDLSRPVNIIGTSTEPQIQITNHAVVPSFEVLGSTSELYYPFNCTVSETTQWSNTGERSLYVNPDGSPVGTSQSSRVVVASSTMLERGKTYSASVVVRKATSTTTPSGRYVRSLEFQSDELDPVWDSAPASSGVHQVSITFTTPTTGNFNLYIRNGDDRGLFFDSLIITEGDEPFPYFDGDMSMSYKNQVVKSEWTGTPHKSKSIATFIENLPEKSMEGNAMIVNDHLLIFFDGSWVNVGAVPDYP